VILALVVFKPVICTDDDACTDDSCDKYYGCNHIEISCEDNNACTNDSCDMEVGCINEAITGDDFDELTSCYEFASNDSCVYWTVDLDYRTGEIVAKYQ